MDSLPTEILEEILSLVLLADDSCSSPPSILLTCCTFHNVGSKQLYSHLRFRTPRQLYSFLGYYGLDTINSASASNPGSTPTSSSVPIPYPPRTMEFCLSNDLTTRVFYHMHKLFVLYQRLGAELDGSERIVLESLWWGFNSHMKDPELETIRRVLALVNPRRFSWTGPDPLHHFSIAIVPPAVPYLFQGLAGFTNLQELTLTHIALTVNTEIIRAPFPVLSTLEKLHIGQATSVDPGIIARAVLSTVDLPESKLQEVRLVDVYKESIWGPRLRRSDLEEAAASIAIADASNITASLGPTDLSSMAQGEAEPSQLLKFNLKVDSVKQTIRTVVVCQAKAERKYGGDRAQVLQSPLDSL